MASGSSMSMPMSSASGSMSGMQMPSSSMGDMGGMHSMSGSSGSHSMGSMGVMGGMDGMNGSAGSHTCSMRMLGNWDTINSCFLTYSWYNNTIAKFAGTCIGVAFWVMLTECIRRWAREYDRYIIAKATREIEEYQAAHANALGNTEKLSDEDVEMQHSQGVLGRFFPVAGAGAARAPRFSSESAFVSQRLRPTMLQQIIRAVLYAVQFTSAYLIMLISMSFNGYILLSIILGAMIGFYFSTWDTLGTVQLRRSPCDTPRVQMGSPQAAPESGLWTQGDLAGNTQPQSLASTRVLQTSDNVPVADQTCNNCSTHTCIS